MRLQMAMLRNGMVWFKVYEWDTGMFVPSMREFPLHEMCMLRGFQVFMFILGVKFRIKAGETLRFKGIGPIARKMYEHEAREKFLNDI